MKLLVDMGHPAHVHFFRHAIRELESRGHEVRITARDKAGNLLVSNPIFVSFTL